MAASLRRNQLEPPGQAKQADQSEASQESATRMQAGKTRGGVSLPCPPSLDLPGQKPAFGKGGSDQGEASRQMNNILGPGGPTHRYPLQVQSIHIDEFMFVRAPVSWHAMGVGPNKTTRFTSMCPFTGFHSGYLFLTHSLFLKETKRTPKGTPPILRNTPTRPREIRALGGEHRAVPVARPRPARGSNGAPIKTQNAYPPKRHNQRKVWALFGGRHILLRVFRNTNRSRINLGPNIRSKSCPDLCCLSPFNQLPSGRTHRPPFSGSRASLCFALVSPVPKKAFMELSSAFPWRRLRPNRNAAEATLKGVLPFRVGGWNFQYLTATSIFWPGLFSHIEDPRNRREMGPALGFVGLQPKKPQRDACHRARAEVEGGPTCRMRHAVASCRGLEGRSEFMEFTEGRENKRTQ